MSAESPATSTDLIFLGFLGGFALATLIFWPLLHRARTRLEHPGTAPTGKHAKRSDQKPALPQPAPRKAEGTDQQATAKKAGATAVTVPAAAGATAITAAGSAEGGGSGDGAAVSTAHSSEGAAEGAEAPPVKDLFEEHYGPKFDLVRDRLASLREQINGEC